MPNKLQKPIIVLGVDPGLADTGYGLIKAEKNRLSCLAHGSIKTAKKENLPERLLTLHNELEKIIKKFKPEKLAIEKLFFAKNVSTAMAVGQARGVVMMLSAKYRLPVIEFSPAEIKQAATGYGNADKKQMQAMVKIILKLKTIPRPDDAADALAAAICGSRRII